jgi:hypothetical protein
LPIYSAFRRLDVPTKEEIIAAIAAELDSLPLGEVLAVGGDIFTCEVDGCQRCWHSPLSGSLETLELAERLFIGLRCSPQGFAAAAADQGWRATAEAISAQVLEDASYKLAEQLTEAQVA